MSAFIEAWSRKYASVKCFITVSGRLFGANHMNSSKQTSMKFESKYDHFYKRIIFENYRQSNISHLFPASICWWNMFNPDVGFVGQIYTVFYPRVPLASVMALWDRVVDGTAKVKTAHSPIFCLHYTDVIMSAMASPITSCSMVCSTVCSGANQRKQ